MKAAAIFTVCLTFSRYSEAVNVEEPAIQQKKDVQQTSGLMLMYKFMEDMFVIRKEMIAIRSELSVQDIENKKLKEDIRELKSQLDQQQSQNAKQESQIAEQKSQIVEHKKTTERLQNQISKEIKDSGVTYVRWGRTQCPNVNGTIKVYEGFAAGDHYTHKGGGVELLCLPKEPTWGEYSDSHIGNAYVYGTEYEINRENSLRLFGKEILNQNVPCVVCQSVGRFTAFRIPGRTDCYSGWTEEYRGYLMTGHHGHAKSTDYTCVDPTPEAVRGKSNNQEGRLLYPVEAYCGDDSLPCPPYVNGRELACVVCTK